MLALLAVAAPAIAHWQLGSVTQQQRELYRLALCGTELFPASRDDPGVSTRRICAALTTGMSYHMLHFLLLPAFFALMVPSRFERRLFAAGRGQATLIDSDQLALILNTIITAHLQEDSDLLRGAFSGSVDAAASCNSRQVPYALMGGGRLIFTNLLDRQAFPCLRLPRIGAARHSYS